MSSTEIRVEPNHKWRMALLMLVAGGVLYYMLGYLPFIVWIAGAVLLVVLVVRLIRPEGEGPCIVLNDEGVFDRRLKVGVIRWDDIRRMKWHNLQGANYISLELHNHETYDARRPAWLKLVSQVQRGFGMSSLAISTSGLDMDTETILRKLHQGCERVNERSPDAT
jgi:hypothetical protein